MQSDKLIETQKQQDPEAFPVHSYFWDFSSYFQDRYRFLHHHYYMTPTIIKYWKKLQYLKGSEITIRQFNILYITL